MNILNKLFVAIAVFLFLGVSAIAQEAGLYGLVTPFEEMAERGADEDQQSVLYKIDPETGVGTMIGGTGFTQCSGLDFEPVTNELFAVCRRIGDENEEDVLGVTSSRVDPEAVRDVLVMVDRTTGNAVEIGPLNIPDADAFTLPSDISFSRDGVLHTHVLNDTNDAEGELSTNVTTNGIVGSDLLGLVDTASGQFTTIGQTGFSNLFSGIAFSPNNTLYHAGGGDTNLVNRLDGNTGAAGFLTPLQYPEQIAEMDNIVTSMDAHSVTGQLFAVIFSQDTRRTLALTRNEEAEGFYLTTIDPISGQVAIIGMTVDGLGAIAFLNKERVPIPALSEIGTVIMVAAFLAAALFVLRRRRSASEA